MIGVYTSASLINQMFFEREMPPEAKSGALPGKPAYVDIGAPDARKYILKKCRPQK
jgi:hypothetical protein